MSLLENLDGITHDASSGEGLDEELITKARVIKMETFKRHGVHAKVPVEEHWRARGKKPIRVKWVDVHAGDAKHPEYGSRLVAKQIKRGKREDLFAATPPLEAKKLLFSLRGSRGETCLDFVDVVGGVLSRESKEGDARGLAARAS